MALVDSPELTAPAEGWRAAIERALAEPAWATRLLGDKAALPGWDVPAAVAAGRPAAVRR
jgi:hypothetical protein